MLSADEHSLIKLLEDRIPGLEAEVAWEVCGGGATLSLSKVASSDHACLQAKARRLLPRSYHRRCPTYFSLGCLHRWCIHHLTRLLRRLHMSPLTSRSLPGTQVREMPMLPLVYTTRCQRPMSAMSIVQGKNYQVKMNLLVRVLFFFKQRNPCTYPSAGNC
jgi:hypothetical protein